jgi:HlyD family secretion protein
MLKGDSTFTMLIVAAILALGVGYYVPKAFVARPAEPPKIDMSASSLVTGAAKAASSKPEWAASAPGRVEPAGGEARIGAQVPGRVVEVLVAANDKVAAGDLLVRLEDDDLLPRIHAAAAEAAVRKRERDSAEAAGKPAQDRRAAEDALATAERQLAQARDDLDRTTKQRRDGTGSVADVDQAREAVTKARERLWQARDGLRKALAVEGLPPPTRPEVALTAARADLSLAEAALEKTRIRAAAAGTVLQVTAKVGESIAPTPEAVLLVMGDLSSLRVRAEFEERDLGKVRVGQAAVVRSDAFPGRDFEGKVTFLAQSLGPSRFGQRGPRKPTDVDVLEVLIELNGKPPLLPGMRVDVFLRNDVTALPRAKQTAVQAAEGPGRTH